MLSRRFIWPAAVVLLLGLIGVIMVADYRDLLVLLQVQAPGADYSCFWAGAKTAMSSPAQLYDFRHITVLQNWPLGPADLRPYIYPPSALFVFIPFALAPYWVGFGFWVALTGAFYLWAAMKAGSPWWVALAPCVLLIVDCGQVPFLMGGLIIGALALRQRPILAGVLLGIAACVKPQFVVLVPLALLAEGRWRTLLAAGATGVLLCAASALIWGVQAWADWLAALPRFHELVVQNRGLVATGSTPYAMLTAAGIKGAWAFLLAPVALGAVWVAFREGADMPDRLIAVFGGTLMITPYAMNYEYALLAPSVAAYLARVRDRRWPAYALAAAGYLHWIWNPPALFFALALPLLRRFDAARDPDAGSRLLQILTSMAYIRGRRVRPTMEINAREISGLDPGAIPGGSTNLPSGYRREARGRSASTDV